MITTKITSVVTTLSYNSRLELEMEDPLRGMTELDDGPTHRERELRRVSRRNLVGAGGSPHSRPCAVRSAMP